jgi:hypothetical protein
MRIFAVIRHPHKPNQELPRLKSRFVEALMHPELPCGITSIIRDVERIFARHAKRPPESESFELTAQGKSA